MTRRTRPRTGPPARLGETDAASGPRAPRGIQELRRTAGTPGPSRRWRPARSTSMSGAARSPAGDNRERRRVQGEVRRQQHPGQQPKDADPRQNTRECQAPGQIAEPEHLAHRAPVNRQDEWCEGNPGQPTNIKRRETQDQKETGENREGGSSQSSQSPQSKFNRVDRQGRLGRPGRLDYSSLPWHFLYFFPLP